MASIIAPQVIITEQPRSKPIRYRYKCEGRSAGTIPGELSTEENKTYPSIKIIGYRGNATVIVSCVTKEPPYRPHPHSLVGREGCHNGICTLDIPSTTLSVTFSNLGIQCVRRKDISQALDKRQHEVKIDPFNTGFDHRKDASAIDMNVVRLCFQVFIEDRNGQCTIPLQPVVSEPVYDIKALGNLVICRLSECVSPVDGGKKDIYLLCKKVAKDNIKVRFFEGNESNPTWEGYPDIQPTQIHEQTAIWFKAPPYKNLDISEPAKVFIQLLRPSDGATSDARPFQFIPIDAEPGALKRKRQKFGNDPRKHILLELQKQLQDCTPSQFNIPPTPNHLQQLDLNTSLIKPSGNIFIFPHAAESPSSSQPVNIFQNPLITPHNEKILNTNYAASNDYLQYEGSTSIPYQNFREPKSATPGLYSPICESVSPPPLENTIINHANLKYINTMEPATLPNKFITTTFNAECNQQAFNDMEKQVNRERVKNAIRAKCKSLQNNELPQSISSINDKTPTYINQLELRNEITNYTNNATAINVTLANEMQNNFEGYSTNSSGESFGNLLDVDFDQLENILIPNDEDQNGCLNIPMNAMTISDTSLNLSSLLNMDTSQVQMTISSEQLDKLLAII